jgi:hypothetical protein
MGAFMDFVGTARAIWFVVAIVGLGIFGLIWLLYVSHCFLTVLTESSVGDAEVRWPDETILDWWLEPVYCLGFLIFCATIASVLMAFFMLVNPWVYAVAVGIFLWYVYPVGLVCVMDARSQAADARLPLALRLVGHLPTMLLVGLATLLPAILVFGSLAGLLLQSIGWALPAALLLPPALFFYARCWGRFAWLVLNIKPRTKKPAPEVPPSGSAHAKIADPWAVPPAEPIRKLEVAIDEPAPLPASELDDNNEREERPAPYVVSPKPGYAADKQADGFTHTEYFDEYRKRQEAREARAEGRKPGEKKRRRRASFRNAFGADLLPFFVQRRTIRAGLSLALATLLFLFFVRIAILTMPAGG